MIRSSLAGLGLSAVLAMPALAQNDCAAAPTATHTTDAVIYDSSTKRVVMVVCPTNDAELNDPAFHPPGTTRVLVAHAAGIDPVSTAIGANALAGIMGPKQIASSIQQSISKLNSTSLSTCLANSACSTSLANVSSSLSVGPSL